jgi:hypothetical protein
VEEEGYGRHTQGHFVNTLLSRDLLLCSSPLIFLCFVAARVCDLFMALVTREYRGEECLSWMREEEVLRADQSAMI